MDVFVEQLVRRRITAKDMFLSIIYVVLAIALFFFLVFLMPVMFGEITSLPGAILGLAVIYGAYYIISNMSIEYEYIVTNGEIDVDKVIAKRKRKRLVTANARTFEVFGVYNASEHIDKEYSCRIFACEGEADSSCHYAIFSHTKLGKTLLVFSPDNRTIEALKKFIPVKAIDALNEETL